MWGINLYYAVMGKWAMRSLPAVAILATTSLTTTWVTYHSSTYPYSIGEPLSFRHLAIQTTSNRNVDFFFPSLGSSVTDVSIYATNRRGAGGEVTLLRSQGGVNIRQSGSLSLGAHRYPVMQADFRSLGIRWRTEGISFGAQGMVWYLTASYDLKYRYLRPTMLRMLASFRLHL